MTDAKRTYESEVIDLPSARISILGDDILRIAYKDQSTEFTLEQAKMHTEAMDKLQNGEPYYLLVNFLDADVNISNEARDYFAHDQIHARLRLCQAIVIGGLAQKLVAHFYKNFHRPDCPIGIFNNEADAIKWISDMRK